MKLLTTALYAGIFSFGLLPTANAALEVRLGGKAVYDTDLNITWLADANYAETSGFDDDGRMNWLDANIWAASLNIGGINGWRLPTTDIPCQVYNCTGSEMGHLFYNELGGTAGSSILLSLDPDLALFTNIVPSVVWSGHWSGTEFVFPRDPGSSAWIFSFLHGYQDAPLKFNELFAWPVHDGDVAALIPEPQTYAMLLTGLLAIFGFRRFKQHN